MLREYELSPTDSRKSFYGKCKVIVEDDGREILYSYGTKIMTKYPDGKLVRHWGGWSATTGRHIASFCGLNKKQYLEMENDKIYGN